MARKDSGRKKLVTSVIRKFPEADNRTLARYLYEKHPEEFASVEQARHSVRYYRGNAGAKNRARSDDSLHRPNGKAGQSFNIPAGLKQTRRMAHIKEPGKYLILSDLHVPYHSEIAIEAALRYGIDEGCEHVVLNGDFLDFYKLSRWSQDPRYRSVAEELETGKEILAEIERHFAGSDSVKVYKVGNHEDRYEQFLYAKASALVGVDDFQLKKILPIEPKNWRFVHSKQLYKLGKLLMLHGHEVGRGLFDPVNIARGMWLRLQQTAMVGHWHRTSTHVETTGVKETVIPCYSVGALCDLSPDYAPVNKWNAGFAIVHLDVSGNFQVRNLIIHQGKVYET